MISSIGFPNIGIELENVGKSITVFGYEIAFYGMIIGFGIIMGILIAAAEAKRTKQNPEDYFDLALYAVIFAIMGARLYYVVFSWSSYKDNLLAIFNLRQGGLAIYGGVIAAVITVFIFGKVKKLSATLLLDTAGLGLVIGQAIGRWGNFFNREAFGEYTDSILAMRLPVDMVRASDITDTMLANVIYIDDLAFIQVHPTFLYESLWCVGVFLLMVLYRKVKKFNGEVFLVYLAGYGAGRFWIEGLRTDQLTLSNGVAVSQLLAGVLVIVSISAILILRNKNKNKIEIEEN
ncbi:MAG: prolipoprotein diacylglyceryl transferase [Eubacteriales bacterium]